MRACSILLGVKRGAIVMGENVNILGILLRSFCFLSATLNNGIRSVYFGLNPFVYTYKCGLSVERYIYNNVISIPTMSTGRCRTKCAVGMKNLCTIVCTSGPSC